MNFPPPYYKWRPHPWHGLEVGDHVPNEVNAYIEMTPFDLVKYEIDKETGYLRVDRPQRASSHPPSLYGFIPRTYCGQRVHALMQGSDRGDSDPLDICVFSERPITRSEVVLSARVIGGLPMLDAGEADDKIVAVLANDNLWNKVNDISNFPDILIERLRHYFLTYKMIPGRESDVVIGEVYGRQHAIAVIRAALDDYEHEFGSG